MLSSPFCAFLWKAGGKVSRKERRKLRGKSRGDERESFNFQGVWKGECEGGKLNLLQLDGGLSGVKKVWLEMLEDCRKFDWRGRFVVWRNFEDRKLNRRIAWHNHWQELFENMTHFQASSNWVYKTPKLLIWLLLNPHSKQTYSSSLPLPPTNANSQKFPQSKEHLHLQPNLRHSIFPLH
jgi:hypothetical protein